MAKNILFTQSVDKAVASLEALFRNFENADGEDENRFVSVLISRPGLGKSATIAKLAKKMGYTLIDLNLACIEPTDIIGLGAREKVNGKWQTLPALPQWAELALRGKCIIFVDEFNNTTQDVLAGFQKMFSDFVIDGQKLPRTTHIIGACNPPGKDAIFAAKKLSGAFRRRLCFLPLVDDFEYVMKKHNFLMPKNLYETNYEEIAEYLSYDEISSAVVDNVFNISSYEGLSYREKVSFVAGFGSKALEFARQLRLFPEEAFSAGTSIFQEEALTYQEWKKEPRDVVDEYQQILWGQESITNSVSYSRSKKFLSRVENPRVYEALYEILKEQFEDDYELDEKKLPASKVSPVVSSAS